MIAFLKILDAIADTLKLQGLDNAVHFVDKLLSLGDQVKAAHEVVEAQKKTDETTPSK